MGIRGIVLVLLVAAYGAPETFAASDQSGEPRKFDPTPVESSAGPGLVGTKAEAREVPRQVVKLKNLADAFRRLAPPELPFIDDTDPRGDTLRLGPKPQPEPGEETMSFPPDLSAGPPPEVKPVPLSVVRYSPEKSVGLVKEVTATFNQPMTALTTLPELDAADPPFYMEPPVSGRFLWKGTRTVAFEAKSRLPLATRYKVTIPTTTEGPAGQALAADLSWEFSTPRPTVTSHQPYSHQTGLPLDTVIILDFNTLVDRLEIGIWVEMTDPSGRKVKLAPVLPEQAAGAGKAPGTNRVTFKPLRPLKKATTYRVDIHKGLISAEGPLPSVHEQSFSFTTYEPLEITEITCGYDEKQGCYPGSSIGVSFNNQIAEQKLEPFFTVSPEPAELQLQRSGARVSYDGAFKPSSSYSVQVMPGIVDIFGQKLKRGAEKNLRYRSLGSFLQFLNQEHVIIEAHESHDLTLTSMNLAKARLRMAPVSEHMIKDVFSRTDRYWERQEDPLAGMEVAYDEELSLGDEVDQVSLTSFTVDKVLDAGKFGAVLVDLRPLPTEVMTDNYNHRRSVTLVQVTDLGLTWAESGDDIVVQVASLSGGGPVGDVQARLLDRDWKILAEGTTDKQGVVRFPGTAGQKVGTQQVFLVAQKGKDRVFMSFSGYYSYRPERNGDLKPTPLAYLFSERGLYRPAEEVNLTVVARLRTRGPDGDLVGLEKSRRSFTYSVRDPMGNEVAKGDLELSAFGVGSFSLTPAKDAPLGNYQVTVQGLGEAFGSSFQVEEYKAPEYRVDVAWRAGGSNILVWRKLDVSVNGSYFYGAPMAGAKVQWTLTRSPGGFFTMGNQGFHFADLKEASLGYHRGHWGYWQGPEVIQQGSGALDANGQLNLPLTLEPASGSIGPQSFTLEANVLDENRQAVAGRATITAHRAERYAGIQVDRSIVSAGERLEVSGVVTRLDGTRYKKARIRVSLLKASLIKEVVPAGEDSETQYTERYVEEEKDSCTLKTGRAAGRCSLKVPEGGTYLVRALTMDQADRPARSAIQIRALGRGAPGWKPDPNRQVELMLDKTEYQPGDKARVLVQSPFEKAQGLATVSREGFIRVVPVEVKNGTASFEFLVEEAWIPGVSMSVVLSRGRTAPPGETTDDPGRPIFAIGSRTLKISTDARKIRVVLKPSVDAIEPGGTFTLKMETRDAGGRGIRSNVALMVVDEGVLSLIAYVTPDPLGALYRLVSSRTAVGDLRALLLPRTPPEIQEQMVEERRSKRGEAMPCMSSKSMEAPMSPGASSGPGGDAGAPGFSLREIFKSTAYFEGDLKTGKDGRLKVDIKMPDNVTEFRIMAVASDQAKRFGSGQSKIRTRRTLIVRPSLPRFLNLGDSFDAAVVVDNQTGFDTEVLVRCLAINASIDEPMIKVPIANGESREVRFHAKPDAPGPAVFQFAAVALTKSRDTDAAQLTIPVLIPATSEAFATYGVVDEAIRQPLGALKDVLPQVGGLDVSLSSTALTGLQDAVSYLFEYPYECTEQTASRILPILALGKVLNDFRIGGADTPKKARGLVQRGIKKILSHQRDDGGWGSWAASSQSWLYLSAYATMTLEMARRKDFAVPDESLNRAKWFLQQRLAQPHEWEEKAWGAQSMAALVLARLGEPPTDHLARLYGVATRDQPGARPELDGPMTLYARAWLMEALGRASADDPRVDEIYRQISNAAVETASAIHFSESRHELLNLMMHSEDRTDAIVLEALVAVRPESPLIEKVVRGLVRARVRGRWSTTQANAYALMALSEYYRIFERDEPDFEARLWHGERFLTGRKFQGREMTIAKTRVPMKELLGEAAKDLILAKTGPGRLYYRLGLTYAPSNLHLDPENRGFSVTRQYSLASGDGSVEKRKDGTWVVAAGSYVRVNVQVTTPDRRYYVAVVDPLPAGLEIVNEKFQTSSRQATGSAGGYWWWSPWEHAEKRDDRVQLFRDRLQAGAYGYTYVARATTIGSFVVPPTRAEEMYTPETFGRSGTEAFIVTP